MSFDTLQVMPNKKVVSRIALKGKVKLLSRFTFKDTRIEVRTFHSESPYCRIEEPEI